MNKVRKRIGLAAAVATVVTAVAVLAGGCSDGDGGDAVAVFASQKSLSVSCVNIKKALELADTRLDKDGRPEASAALRNVLSALPAGSRAAFDALLDNRYVVWDRAVAVSGAVDNGTVTLTVVNVGDADNFMDDLAARTGAKPEGAGNWEGLVLQDGQVALAGRGFGIIAGGRAVRGSVKNAAGAVEQLCRQAADSPLTPPLAHHLEGDALVRCLRQCTADNLMDGPASRLPAGLQQKLRAMAPFRLAFTADCRGKELSASGKFLDEDGNALQKLDIGKIDPRLASLAGAGHDVGLFAGDVTLLLNGGLPEVFDAPLKALTAAAKGPALLSGRFPAKYLAGGDFADLNFATVIPVRTGTGAKLLDSVLKPLLPGTVKAYRPGSYLEVSDTQTSYEAAENYYDEDVAVVKTVTVTASVKTLDEGTGNATEVLCVYYNCKPGANRLKVADGDAGMALVAALTPQSLRGLPLTLPCSLNATVTLGSDGFRATATVSGTDRSMAQVLLSLWTSPL